MFFLTLFLGLSVLSSTLSAASIPASQQVLGKHQFLGSSFGIPGVDATFDYVVVGGGTAGLTLAARLAEDPRNSVAIIEAGGFYEVENGNISSIPAEAALKTGADLTNVQPLVDWGFATTPQAGANDRVLLYSRGKTLGGTSARNYMAYHRPTVGSLKKWADEVGDSSYTWSKLLRYYKRSVHYTPPNPELYHNSTFSQDPSAFSATGGPLQVSFGNFLDVFPTWMQRACEALGMKGIPGLNSGELIGSAFLTWTVDPKNSHRSSSETSFLRSVIAATNLQVYTHTMAEKILFDADEVATGVAVSTAGTYGTPGVKFILTATKEVIISAGAFQSPQLLMVSGLGPRTTLENLDIPVVKDLPGVGQNLWDQPLFGIAHRVNFPTASAFGNDPALFGQAVQLYLQNATGPLSIFGGGFFGFEKLPAPYRQNLSSSTKAALSQFPADWPEIEWLPVSAYVGYNRNSSEDPRDGFNYATLDMSLPAPLSRGNVTINSKSMNDPPVINPNWLTHPADMELAVAAFRRGRQIWSVLASYNITIGEESLPGPTVQTDGEILNFIRECVIEIYHASATCKMGKANDSMAVVDTRARVHGVKNLRVVDASIFPFLPPGHPQSTVYCLAEKIAEDILLNGKTDFQRQLNQKWPT